MKKNLARQQGTAIIVALFVTALVAAAAIAMIDFLRIDTRRTQLVINNLTATQYAQGSIDWAIDQLINNEKTKQKDKPTDKLPMRSPVNTIGGMKIYSTIYDAQSRLNVNMLADKQTQDMFGRLIRITAPGTNAAVITQITQGVVDWITYGIVNSPFDQYYAKLKPPYHAAHQPMTSVSELRLVRGMTPALYAKIAPYITALPEKTGININTASLPLLMSLSDNVSLETAKVIDELRRASPITSLANFNVVKNNSIDQNSLATSSVFFMVITHVIAGEQDTLIYTLLKRVTRDGQPAVIIIWQTKGTV